MTNSADTISSEEPLGPGRPGAEARPSGVGVRATAMSAALTLVVATGVATAAYRGTSDDTAPTSLIPANAFAVAAADLSLPGGQSDSLETLLDHFPGLHLTGDGSIRDRIMRSMLKSVDPPIDYDADVKPWLGDHVAVAGWNDNGKPQLEVVLQSTDDSSARQHLTTIVDGHGHVAMHDGYAVVANTQQAVDDALAAASRSSLDDAGAYSGDIGALPDNEAITAWFNGPEAKDVLGNTVLGGAGGALQFSPLGTFGSGFGTLFKGRVALGVHVTDTVAELDARSTGQATTTLAPATMLTTLPSGTIGAVELGSPGSVIDAATPVIRFLGSFAAETGSTVCMGSGTSTGSFAPDPLGGIPRKELLRQIRQSVPPGPNRRAIIRRLLRQHDRAVRQLHRLNNGSPPTPTTVPAPDCHPSSTPQQLTDPLTQIQQSLGISFPDDVKTVLGQRAVVAFGGLELAGLPDVAIRSHPSELSTAQSLANTLSTHLSSSTPVNIDVSTAGDDLVLATSPSYGHEIATGGDLGGQDLAEAALGGIPDAVSVAAYVDLTRVWPLVGDSVPAALQHLHAVGFWADQSADVQSAQLRLVFG